MLIDTLVKLIPEKGELRITVVKEASGVRLAIIPKPAEVKENSDDKEFLARQGAVISPIVLRFDPGADGLDQAISEEIAGYVPHVASAAERLAQFEAEQEQRRKESDAAAKEKADKLKAKGKATTKAAGGEAPGAKPAETPKPEPDLFSTSVPTSPAAAEPPIATAPGGEVIAEADALSKEAAGAAL